MNINYAQNKVHFFYLKVVEFYKSVTGNISVFLRRMLRFAALPYCFFYNVNWSECRKSKPQVILDFLYIFFILKTYPDNYSPCRLWNKPRTEWGFYYGSNYDPYQRQKLQKNVQLKKFEVVYENKRLCTDICNYKDLPIPLTFSYFKKESIFLDAYNEIIKCGLKSDLVLKPCDGKGGVGILFFEQQQSTGKFVNSDGVNISMSEALPCDMILQERIVQHRDLERFSCSVNTIRIVTLKASNDEVLILGAYLRLGVGLSRIDNISQGGLGVAIDLDTGHLVSEGYNKQGEPYTSHPISKIVFEQFKVPYWQEIKSLAILTQFKLDYQRLLGLDIAVSQEGPMIIELNSIFDNVGLEQKCGPILKNPTILKSFGDLGLLVNKKQKMHYRALENDLKPA